MKKLSDEWISWIILIILALIWGSSFILIKKGLKELASDEVGALRIVSASLFLMPFALKRLNRIQKKHIPLLFCVGLAGSLFPAFLFAKAQTQIDSSSAGILNALTPLFTILIGFLVFRQRFHRDTVLGLILGFIGIVFLMVSGSKGDISQINFYALFVVLATALYGLNLNLIKFKIPDLTSVTITSISLFFVGPLALAYLYFFTPFFTALSTSNESYLIASGAIVLLGVMGTAIALVLFNQLVKLTHPVFASSVTYLIPVVAVMWGIIDSETIRLTDYLGFAAIISGVYMANYKKRKAQEIQGL